MNTINQGGRLNRGDYNDLVNRADSSSKLSFAGADVGAAGNHVVSVEEYQEPGCWGMILGNDATYQKAYIWKEVVGAVISGEASSFDWPEEPRASDVNWDSRGGNALILSRGECKDLVREKNDLALAVGQICWIVPSYLNNPTCEFVTDAEFSMWARVGEQTSAMRSSFASDGEHYFPWKEVQQTSFGTWVDTDRYKSTWTGTYLRNPLRCTMDATLPKKDDIVRVFPGMMQSYSEGGYLKFENIWNFNASGSASPLIDFMLKTNLTPGSSADAYLLKADGTPDTSASTIVVHDLPETTRRAFGKNSHSTNAAKGKCFYNELTSKYEIVSMIVLAKLCKASTVASSINATDATFTVDNIEVLDDGQSPVESSSATLSVVNWCAWQANASGKPVVIVHWSSGTYAFLQGGCFPAPTS
jgi:hypothetical protein